MSLSAVEKEKVSDKIIEIFKNEVFTVAVGRLLDEKGLYHVENKRSEIIGDYLNTVFQIISSIILFNVTSFVKEDVQREALMEILETIKEELLGHVNLEKKKSACAHTECQESVH